MSLFKIDIVSEAAMPGARENPEYRPVYMQIVKHDSTKGVVRITATLKEGDRLRNAIISKFSKKQAEKHGFWVTVSSRKVDEDKMEVFVLKHST